MNSKRISSEITLLFLHFNTPCAYYMTPKEAKRFSCKIIRQITARLSFNFYLEAILSHHLTERFILTLAMPSEDGRYFNYMNFKGTGGLKVLYYSTFLRK